MSFTLLDSSREGYDDAFRHDPVADQVKFPWRRRRLDVLSSIELRNETDWHVLWLTGSRETLDVFLSSNTGFSTTAPGGRLLRQHVAEADPPDWCDPPEISHFLLRTRNGQPLDGLFDPIEVSFSDFEIVAMLGPGHCWGETDAVWELRG